MYHNYVGNISDNLQSRIKLQDSEIFYFHLYIKSAVGKVFEYGICNQVFSFSFLMVL